ncbi:MAG: excinuclease ABC subunit UvrC [Simkaniaceae bacterium]|nr:excinuclease ABC subunit UvrC [Simkaniaceae bacterium]MCF7851675.1 excinuclease ABC subunit UvrC [Simkaniaceae bacterium]
MADFNWKTAHFPKEPGVYLMRNKKGAVLYVGKAKNLKTRISQYFQEGRDTRQMIPYLIAQIAHIETIITLSEKEALLLENSLIKQHKPKYNVLLKDDKTYISLMINPNDQWPMLQMLRFKGKPKEKGLYFGPYTSGFAARQTYETLLRAFPLRQCSDRELKSRARPCLLYDMKRCMAPCVNLCTHEEYAELVTHIVRFLKGSDLSLVSDLEKKRKQYANALEFEKAALIHEQIKALKQVIEHHRYTTRFDIDDTDVLAIVRKEMGEACIAKILIRSGRFTDSRCFYIPSTLQTDDEVLTTFILQHYATLTLPPQIFTPMPLHHAIAEILEEMGHEKPKLVTPRKGEKKNLIAMAEKNASAFLESHTKKEQEAQELLMQLQEVCQLSHFPSRIECFDTSHMSMENPVASMAVFINGKKSKNESRLYKIKHAEKSEDYYSMKETLERRLSRGKKEDHLPNLIILDGGKGQLNLAKKILSDLNIVVCDLIAFAKEEARHDKGLSAERIFTTLHDNPISLPLKSPLQFFLQNIRDDAHDMAINYYRKQKSKSLISSSLDTIEGIGPKKRALLLTHFGSVKAIQRASLEEITQVKGISQTDAKNIKKALNIVSD